MLTNLSIRNIVLIDRLELEIEPGLSVLTGETGAGKSILLDSLGLATGVRADTRLVRSGAQQASVSAIFDIPSTHDVHTMLVDHDLSIGEGDLLILRRTLAPDGRSRAYINDQAVGVNLLRTVGERLLEIHGQFDNQRLFKPDEHMRLLDAFAGHSELVSQCKTTFQAWRKAIAERQQIEKEVENARLDEDFIRQAVTELQQINPLAEEESDLASQRQLMMHGEQLVEILGEVLEHASGYSGCQDKLHAATRALERAAERTEGRLDAAITAFDQAADSLADGISEINRLSSDLDLNPGRLDEIEDRLFSLRALARKHNVPVSQLPQLFERLSGQLNTLEDGSSGLHLLYAKENKNRDAYVNSAKLLSKSRLNAAKELDDRVASELAGLHLDKAKFETKVELVPESDWRSSGIDKVNFLVATNPGTQLGLISKIASGGEMARFMLALKVVLAAVEPMTTLVFDEVDSGVGGAVAQAVGERMRSLGDGGQVLVVTHSPQVAARGNSHWRIAKRSSVDGESGSEVLTTVDTLDAIERREEIARMLAGRTVTDEARLAAESLLSGPLS
ncbi:MAG: DNA repair protein RecN [Rhodospirillaceae bacterium TMED8]|nr:DNA repair protein RecN [Magnetovibrio sp.]OUT52307.1 MAG: DNA repair protein RecN [Rhodospirillaceae bacterium TMED8]